MYPLMCTSSARKWLTSPSMYDLFYLHVMSSGNYTAIYLNNALESLLKIYSLDLFKLMNLYLSVNSDSKIRWKSLFIYECLLEL